MLRLDSSVGGLEFFAPGCLAGKKKCLRILALSAESARAEIFAPGTFGGHSVLSSAGPGDG